MQYGQRKERIKLTATPCGKYCLLKIFSVILLNNKKIFLAETLYSKGFNKQEIKIQGWGIVYFRSFM